MITAAPESVGLVPERLIKAMAVLDDAVADNRIGGAVFGMVREGKLAFLQAVGYRDTAKTERMRPHLPTRVHDQANRFGCGHDLSRTSSHASD